AYDEIADPAERAGYRPHDDEHGEHARQAETVEARDERAHQECDEHRERDRDQNDLREVECRDDDRDADEPRGDMQRPGTFAGGGNGHRESLSATENGSLPAADSVPTARSDFG